MCLVYPTPSPNPPGEPGLCPIIVDSVMSVSVIVSIAMSPMTGVASFSRASSMSRMSSPAFWVATRSECTIPGMLPSVPLMPEVGAEGKPPPESVPARQRLDRHFIRPLYGRVWVHRGTRESAGTSQNIRLRQALPIHGVTWLGRQRVV